MTYLMTAALAAFAFASCTPIVASPGLHILVVDHPEVWATVDAPADLAWTRAKLVFAEIVENIVMVDDKTLEIQGQRGDRDVRVRVAPVAPHRALVIVSARGRLIYDGKTATEVLNHIVEAVTKDDTGH